MKSDFSTLKHAGRGSFMICYSWIHFYSVMQSYWNSSKSDTFYESTTNDPHVQISYDQIITFAWHKYGRLGVFRTKMWSIIQNLCALEKWQFPNCSHLFASHCTKKEKRTIPPPIICNKRNCLCCWSNEAWVRFSQHYAH